MNNNKETNILSIIVCYNTSFMCKGGEKRTWYVLCFHAHAVLLGGWNFYIIWFITLTFASHLTSPKMLAAINVRPVLMITKKQYTTKIFPGIIHFCPNATTPEQHNLKFTNTLLCILRHLDFRNVFH